MKRIILLSIALAAFAVGESFANSLLPEDNEVLCYGTYKLDKTYQMVNTTVIAIDGETVIDGKTYKMLRASNSVLNLDEGRIVAFVRSDGDKVYMIENDNENSDPDHVYPKESLLYDFSLKPGDSFTYGDMEMKVESRTEEYIGGKKRIVLYTENPWRYKIISGIGCEENGFFYCPFLKDPGIDCFTGAEKVFFDMVCTTDGKRVGEENGWNLNLGIKDFSPMLKENRIWVYQGDKGNLAYYRLKDKVELCHRMYYPVFRGADENFTDEIFVGYMRERNGQIFLRPCNFHLLPVGEMSFWNYGEETLLYDFNLKEGEFFRLNAFIRSKGDCSIKAQHAKEVNYYPDSSQRRWIATECCEYMEGIGVIKNGTLIFPRISDLDEYWIPLSESISYNLTKVIDNGETMFEMDKFTFSSGISEKTDFAAEAEGEAEYFTLQGIRTDAKAPGIYLRRQGGSIGKIIVR